MAQWSGAALASSPAQEAQRRPCPYCGTWNEAEFSFCAKCGRQLPALATSAAPPAAPPITVLPPPPQASGLPPPPAYAAAPTASIATPAAPAFAAAAATPNVDPSPVAERPMTDAEKSLLTRRAKSGGAGVARFFGAFLGLIPLVFVGTALMGTPYVPENYIAIVLVSGFLALVVSAVGRNLRLPALRAARSGVAHEVYGVPEIRSASGNHSLVTLSELTFRMKTSEASKLLANRMNRLTFADGGPTAGARRAQGGVVTFLLEANGTAATSAELCHLVSAPGLEAAAPAAVGRAKKGVR